MENTQSHYRFFCPLKPEIRQTVLKYRHEDRVQYEICITYSSREDIIDRAGNIIPPAVYTVVVLDYLLKNKKNGEEQSFERVKVLVPAAVAETANTNQTVDYSALRYGIFMHWFANDNKQKSKLVTREETTGGISSYADLCDVEAMVADIADLGFEFFNVTDFHGIGVALHPNAALDYWRGEHLYTSSRDLIREMIDALKKRGVYLSLFTHPLDGHDFPPAQQKLLGFGCGDPSADAGPDQATVHGVPGRERTPEEVAVIEELKATRFQKWNDFVNDVYGDLASRYGKDIIAMGFDSAWGEQVQENIDGVKKLDLNRLRKTIETYAPDLPLASLSPANELTGYSIKEVWRPSWLDPWMERGNHSSDYEGPYDVEDWPCYYRPVAVVTTEHWAPLAEKMILHLTAEQLFRYAVFQISASLEGAGIMWGTTSYIDGGWEKNVRETFTKVNAYMELIRESIKDTFPSLNYFTKEGAQLKTLEHGICATRSRDGKYEYIQVMNPPEGSRLILPLPATGVRFSKAFILNYGLPARIEQTDQLVITLPQDIKWDKLCTSIKLFVEETCVPAPSLAFHKTVHYSTAKSSEKLQNCPYAPPRLVNGIKDYVTKDFDWATELGGWSSLDGDENPFVCVDMHTLNAVGRVVLHPVVNNQEKGEGLPLDFSVYTSVDGLHWKNVFVKTGQEVCVSPVVCEFDRHEARYVKIKSDKLRISHFSLCEMEVFDA